MAWTRSAAGAERPRSYASATGPSAGSRVAGRAAAAPRRDGPSSAARAGRPPRQGPARGRRPLGSRAPCAAPAAAGAGHDPRRAGGTRAAAAAAQPRPAASRRTAARNGSAVARRETGTPDEPVAGRVALLAGQPLDQRASTVTAWPAREERRRDPVGPRVELAGRRQDEHGVLRLHAAVAGSIDRAGSRPPSPPRSRTSSARPRAAMIASAAPAGGRSGRPPAPRASALARRGRGQRGQRADGPLAVEPDDDHPPAGRRRRPRPTRSCRAGRGTGRRARPPRAGRRPNRSGRPPRGAGGRASSGSPAAR